MYFRKVHLINEHTICRPPPILPAGQWTEELDKIWIELSDIHADVESPEIQILFGIDLWNVIKEKGERDLSGGLSVRKTVFGWTIFGEVGLHSLDSRTSCLVTQSVSLVVQSRALSDLWDLDTLGIKDPAESETKTEHNGRVKEELQDKLRRDEDGRYIVSLPWVSEYCRPPQNKGAALIRLEKATASLVKHRMLEKYGDILNEWKSEGTIDTIVVKEKDPQFYLPHRGVLKPESKTTPLKQVFDGSVRNRCSPSLNQCLEPGPNLLELVPSVLLRFRLRKIGVTADIRKAFQMLSVEECDRMYQLFLWWSDVKEKASMVLRHCRVVFGLNCSPFILLAVLEFHLKNVKCERRIIAEEIQKSLYVDNVVTSVDTLNEYNEFKTVAVKIMEEAKMELRCWEKTVTKNEKTDGDEETKVLGLVWNKRLDEISCSLPKIFKEGLHVKVITKRFVLSAVASIFDPIGFTCPALLQPKLLLQEAWARNLSWEEEWKDDKRSQFEQWVQQLGSLLEIKIPRYSFGERKGKVQIHTFVDASCKSYAAMTLVRSGDDDDLRVQLLLAKSRLAPLPKTGKKITIPRLELLGCLIGSRLTEIVKSVFAPDQFSYTYWTDSATCLAWITRGNQWGTFVARRVEEIRKNTEGCNWRFVPGVLNPADLPSRGCTPVELLQSKWFEGPDFLRQKESEWPENLPQPDENAVMAEFSPSVTTVTVDPQPHFSSYLKNVRVKAFVRRFLSNCQHKVRSEGPKRSTIFSRAELLQGEMDLIRECQRNVSPLNPKHKNLHLHLNSEGLLCVKSRLLYADMKQEFKTPIFIPKESWIARQMIEYLHKANCHAGVQFLLGKIRKRFWIPSTRKTVASVLRRCVRCQRYAAQALPVDPAPLPRERIQANYAWETTGVDLFGPLFLKGGSKVWVVIYTCALYRAIQLDVVRSLSSKHFLDSLEKFTFTVGRPAKIFSDNGTNFCGTYNLMRELNWEELTPLLGIKMINWRFIPVHSPWWGGWWERMIRTVKGLMKRMLSNAKLKQNQLERCLMDVVDVINNRPLCTVTEDQNDLEPLTPSMFIRDPPVTGLPEVDHLDAGHLQSAYEKMKMLKAALRQRFRKEYLSQLVQRQSEPKFARRIKEGELVLVGSDNNKRRFEWPLGRVIQMIVGKDGKPRLARIRIAKGEMVRPLQRLYPLEFPGVKKGQKPEANGRCPSPEPLHECPRVTTRKGRTIKKPARYGEWEYRK